MTKNLREKLERKKDYKLKNEPNRCVQEKKLKFVEGIIRLLSYRNTKNGRKKRRKVRVLNVKPDRMRKVCK